MRAVRKTVSLVAVVPSLRVFHHTVYGRKLISNGWKISHTDSMKTDIRFIVLILVAGVALSVAAEGWPEFRGPQANGRIEGARLPLHWSETNNVTWKTPIPHPGWSTPVVLDNRVWLTSATEDGTDYFVFCVDAQSGKMLVEKKLFHCENPEPLGNSVNGYASPSAVIEPGRVYIHFGSYGTACLDTKTGKELWRRTDLPCRHYRGPGSSSIIYNDFLILTFDGVDQQYVTALDKLTGKTVWRTDRSTEWNDLDKNGQPKREGDFRKAFATPLIINTGSKELLISLGSYAMFAYDPLTGKEIWKVSHGGYSSSVSPLFDDGRVLATTGRGVTELLAIDPDGKGEVTETHVLWRFPSKDVTTIPSPLVIDGRIYMISDKGTFTCLEAKTGETVWRERIGGNFIASPLSDGERIYFPNTSGKTRVLQPGKSFTVLAENELDEGMMSSPAAIGNALILRTKTHLYRIEEK